MKNQKVKIFAFVIAGCLCLSGLVGCEGKSKASDDTSSQSSSGLMGAVKEATDTSDGSDADDAGEEDEVSDDMIGRYVSQGYENTGFGLKIALPDTYTLENRCTIKIDNEDPIEASNKETTYNLIRSMVALGKSTVFEAKDENTYIGLSLQKASVLDNEAVWAEEKSIAETSVVTEEEIKEIYGEDVEITEFQNNVEEITFLGEKHYAAQFTFKADNVPYYGVNVYLVNEQDPRYLLGINLLGLDLDAVDQADQFFSVYAN